jgi:hypothetical protein
MSALPTMGKSLVASLLVALLSYPRATSLAADGGAPVDLAVVVNPAVPVQRLSAAELESIFTSSRRNWPDGSSVSAFSYRPEDEVRHAFDGAVLRMSPDEVARFWLDQRVRGGSRPPRQVPDPLLAVRLTARLPGSIAYVPENLVNGSVKVVARIKSGKVVAP